jgi:hypothetical protein
MHVKRLHLVQRITNGKAYENSRVGGNQLGLFDNAVDKRIIKFVQEYTGQTINPLFHAPCRSSVSLDWDGWCALDRNSIWLVNKWGARGVEFENISPSSNWGQYPYGSRGFPKYRFEFFFQNGAGSFTVYPKTSIGGAELNQRLATIFGL